MVDVVAMTFFSSSDLGSSHISQANDGGVVPQVICTVYILTVGW